MLRNLIFTRHRSEHDTFALQLFPMPSHPIFYDLIFAGSGLSGLTLAVECSKRDFFRGKKILLIDRDDKLRNDRTWCFWAKENEPFPPIVYRSWQQCLFFGEGLEKSLDIAPYRYHMIRGADFYRWALQELAKNPNVQRVKANISHIEPVAGVVSTDVGDFQGEWVFNSAQYQIGETRYSVEGNRPAFRVPHSEFTFLLQHFKGWLIETPAQAFHPEAMTFMDYRLEQRGETRFVYVLPLSETQALVEFTVFSPALCTADEYDAELRRYIANVLKIKDFQVLEEEFGVIPMTDFPFSAKNNGRVLNIGTAGGFVKASSGYAFLRTQRKIRKFAERWEQTGVPDGSVLRSPWGFRALDSIMLRVLQEGSVSGKEFFSRLFQKLPSPLVFRFLDEDSTLGETLKILSAPPGWPFVRTAVRQIPFLWKI